MLLEGRGHGRFAPVYARAVRLDVQRGRATLAPTLLVEVMHRTRRGEEPMDVALIADDAGLALNLPLPRGLNLIAVVAERADDNLNPSVALVGGVPDVAARIEEGDFVIVDSGRGRVWVNPTAEQIAALQAEQFRPRVLVGQANTPALTRSGRRVAVWASVTSRPDAQAAVDEGADGLVVTPDGPLGVELMVSDDFAATLRPLVQSIGGGDITLYLPPDSLDIASVVRLAATCKLRLLLGVKELSVPLLDLRQELADAAEAAADEDEAAQVPHVCAFTDDPDYSMAEFSEVVLPLQPDLLDPSLLYGLPPVYVWVQESLDQIAAQFTDPDSDDGARLPPVAGFVVLPEVVQELKEFIRTCE